MRAHAFDVLRAAESSWWYRGRQLVAERLLASAEVRRHGRVLDFGAGFGGMSGLLAPFGELSAVEPNGEAASACRNRGYARVAADIREFETEPASFSLIAAMDVLEHVPEPDQTLASFRKLLSPDGILLINVPAYRWLWGAHDLEHEHFRRYTARGLRADLERNGFQVTRMTYWNTFLFVPMVLVRLLGMGGEASLRLPAWQQRVLVSVMRLEGELLRFLTFPFGGSVMAVARKKI